MLPAIPAAIIAALAWALAANLSILVPSKRKHWPMAWALMVTALPIVTWLAATGHPLAAVLFAAAAISVLRLPLKALARRAGLMKPRPDTRSNTHTHTRPTTHTDTRPDPRPDPRPGPQP